MEAMATEEKKGMVNEYYVCASCASVVRGRRSQVVHMDLNDCGGVFIVYQDKVSANRRSEVIKHERVKVNEIPY